MVPTGALTAHPEGLRGGHWPRAAGQAPARPRGRRSVRSLLHVRGMWEKAGPQVSGRKPTGRALQMCV